MIVEFYGWTAEYKGSGYEHDLRSCLIIAAATIRGNIAEIRDNPGGWVGRHHAETILFTLTSSILVWNGADLACKAIS